MTFTAAKRHARKGALIRRADWDNPLRLNRRRELEFVTAVHTWGKTYDRSYAPTENDRRATDWMSV